MSKARDSVRARDVSELRWTAVCTAELGECEPFFYGVVTTGVFCRPQCSARRPLRKNVEFFDSVADAKAAGYRACKRCRPDDEGGPRVAAMRRVCALIEKSEQPPTLEQLAEVAGLSASRFRRAFKELIGVTPHQYIKAHQRERLQKTLQHADSVTTAIYDAGFGAASRVYEKSDALLGMTPATFRRGGDALTIRYASTACDLGRVLVAATEKGLCAIFLGDDDEPLFAELEARFRAATLERDDSLGDVLAQVVSFVQAPERGLTLPLDIRGTAFQQRVWQTLQTIPVGETRSYRQVAEMLGSPGAVRAVASACAKNPLAVVVPCHRVIGSDGKLHGYHWGLERKQKLLDRESSE